MSPESHFHRVWMDEDQKLKTRAVYFKRRVRLSENTVLEKEDLNEIDCNNSTFLVTIRKLIVSLQRFFPHNFHSTNNNSNTLGPWTMFKMKEEMSTN